MRRPRQYHGPKTEAVIARDGFHISVHWWKRGVEYKRSVYEPMGLRLSPALADLLALALEGGDPWRGPEA